MTFTIEPMINEGNPHTRLLPDGWTVVTKDHTLSAQWEHTVVVTDDGVDVLTSAPGDDDDCETTPAAGGATPASVTAGPGGAAAARRWPRLTRAAFERSIPDRAPDRAARARRRRPVDDGMATLAVTGRPALPCSRSVDTAVASCSRAPTWTCWAGRDAGPGA